MDKGKGNVYPITGNESPEGDYSYSCTLSLTLVLDRGGSPMPCLSHFTPPGKTQYQFYRRLGGPWGRSGQVWEISSPAGI